MLHPMPSFENVSIIIAGQGWKPIDSLNNASPDDRVFTLDPETGHIAFGDGVHGSRPPVGATVEAAYRQGEHAISVSSAIPDLNLRKASLFSVKVLSNSLQFSHYQDVETSWRWKLVVWLCELLKV